MPRAFRFSLQKVLDYRAQLEDQAKLALARAQRAHAEQAAKAAALDERLKAHTAAMADVDGQSAADIWLMRNFAKRLTEDLHLARMQESRLALKVQTRIAELAQKATERKLLEKLKETQAQRHDQEENRKEQAGFDEMATLRYQAPAL